ncbi:MAG: hypothetical protein KDD56_09475, partial [Bdellovibrionales bacterium]|nr:hypothetical protein [Bdellovibrionales bacterium]
MKNKKSKKINFANKTVIQCPCCNTKFAVAKQKLALASFPKFHCSKCDKVFGFSGDLANERLSLNDQIKDAVGSTVFSINSDTTSKTSNNSNLGKNIPTSSSESIFNASSFSDFPGDDSTEIKADENTEYTEQNSDDSLFTSSPYSDAEAAENPFPLKDSANILTASKEFEDFSDNDIPSADVETDKDMDANQHEDQISFNFSRNFKEPEPGSITPSISLNTDALRARGLLGEAKPKQKAKDPHVTSTLLEVPDQYKKLKKWDLS